MTGFTVQPLTKKQVDAIVTRRHYSRRACIFWAGFGLIAPDGAVEGVCVYGQPSPPISKHAFRDRDFRLYELARLVIQTTERNAASALIGRSLKMLEPHSAVVSYADSMWGHVGSVYQATNWLYTGATKSHDSLYLVDGVRTHPMSLRDRGITDPKRWAADNGVETIRPMDKHRYFYLNGTRREVRDMRQKLVYPVLPYPKADKQTYDAGERVGLHVDDANAEGLDLLA